MSKEHLVCYFFLITLFMFSIRIYAHDQDPVYSLTTDKPLQEVLDDTEFAITERNLRITGRLHVGKTIQERGDEEFPANEIILYCSVQFAQKILKLAPDFINFCPGRITIREENNYLIIAAPLWPENTENKELKQHMIKMNELVREIVDFAAKDWLFMYEK